MDEEQMKSLIEGCLRYMRASKLPTPLPANLLEYVGWQEKASEERQIDEDAEEAWFELDHLIAQKPDAAWRVLAKLASQCEDEDTCAQLAAGPLTTFLRNHRGAFSAQIDDELMANDGFRTAYNWLQG
jgi:hypothetical protein